MSDLRKAAEMALDALENHTAIKHPQQIQYRDDAIKALRPAIAQPEWVGLTDNELKEICSLWELVHGGWITKFAKDIEAKLKEKNT